MMSHIDAEEVAEIRKWAKKQKPYPRWGNAWIFSDYTEKNDDLTRKRGVITSAEYRYSERQGYGLRVEVQEECGMCGSWIFYELGDIWEFMQRTNAKNLNDLRGTPVDLINHGFNSIAGLDVVDVLVLEDSE